jgi:hypothetical protein
MSNPASPSRYELLTIKKGDKTIRLDGKTTSFDYYESLRSPNITAKLSFVDVGGSTSYDSKYNPQGDRTLGTIYNALPLTADGTEKVNFKISSKLGDLNFSITPLIVNSSANLDQESNRESIILSLVSESSIKNRETNVKKNYSGSTSNSQSVSLIVNDILQLPQNKVTIEETSNKYPFIGNNEHPFEILMMLAKKSVPLDDGNPGFFFYETRDGHAFRSIDSLLNQEPVAEYYRSDVNRSSITVNNDYKISSFNIIKNQNLISSLEAGMYVNRTVLFNPKTFNLEENQFVLGTDTLKKTLGKDATTPTNKVHSKVLYDVADVGTLSPTISEGNASNDPNDFQGAVQMRYNLLLSQVVKMQVPCNPNLKAGDIVKCYIEKVTLSDKCEENFDPVESGKYLIFDLCHHYDTKRSFTSMTLVRDTYGLYTGN